MRRGRGEDRTERFAQPQQRLHPVPVFGDVGEAVGRRCISERD